jgi:hypothetical protein
MDVDDDMPPELVDTDQGMDAAEGLPEKPVKVPITIVTGELLFFFFQKKKKKSHENGKQNV